MSNGPRVPDRPARGPGVGVIAVIRNALTALGPHRGSFWLLCIASFANGLLESILLFLVARLAMGTANGDDNIVVEIGSLDYTAEVLEVALVAGGVLLLFLAGSLPVALLTARVSSLTMQRARTRLINAYLDAPWSFRASEPEGHLQELMSEYSNRSERAVNAAAIIAVSGLSILAIGLSAVVVAPLGALIAVLGLTGLGFALRPIARRVRRASLGLARKNKRISNHVSQTARLSQEIAAFNVGDQVKDQLGADIRSGAGTLRRIRFAGAFMPSVYQSAALGLVVGLVATLTLMDDVGTGALAPVLLLIVRVLGYGKQMLTSLQTGIELSPYVTGLQQEIDRLSEGTPEPQGVGLPEPGDIVFDDVDFEYTPGVPVLAGISLRIPVGQAVGLVGPSGGGKTTLTQLLLGLRTPTSGSVAVGGTELATIGAADWARIAALVPQDNKLILGTVAENIRFYRPGHTAADVEAAARAAHLHDEIADLPQGYETLIGAGAREISGGQRQRLGIARALLGHPRLLVLDEPTSALDHRSEQLIRQTLAELRGTTTLVIIAHRPATLDVCDRVVLVQAGRLEEVPMDRAIAAVY